MTSTGGLSRRRVAPSSTSNADDADDAWGLNGSSSRHTPTPSLTNSTSSAAGAQISHAGSAFQGGSKIAFDPRDLEREDEDERQGGKAPRLTIMEEVLLLGLKDKQVSCPVLYGVYAVVVVVDSVKGGSHLTAGRGRTYTTRRTRSIRRFMTSLIHAHCVGNEKHSPIQREVLRDDHLRSARVDCSRFWKSCGMTPQNVLILPVYALNRQPQPQGGQARPNDVQRGIHI